LSAVIEMCEQVVHSVVAKSIIVTFPTNEEGKPAKILTRLRAYFGERKPSRTEVYEQSVI